MKRTAVTEPVLARLLDRPEPLSPEAPLTIASARLRGSDLPGLPVVQEGRLVGLIGEQAVLGAVSAAGEPPTCRDWIQPATAVPVTTPPEEAVWLLSRDEVDLLVVLDLDGRYLGVVTRRRMIDAVEEGRRPRVVGGLATPLGVHLTSVHHRGGVGDVSLMLTGLYFHVLLLAASGLVVAVRALFGADPVLAVLQQMSPTLLAIGAVPEPSPGVYLAVTAVFLTLLRLSPLAGYHSGEHQTVHALERGLPLEYEAVRTMPRPHPRCGTNLVVLLTLLMALFGAIRGGQGVVVWLPLVMALLAWRAVGRLVQAWFTTRPASRRQIESGIRAAKMLLARHQRQPQRRANALARIWNRGILQVGLGVTLAFYAWRGLVGLAAWMAMRG